ncbi:MAG: questin oxidase family protein, partial [Acidimicrobiales bacterium]
LDELDQALGYWAARWQPVPRSRSVEGTIDVGAALDAIPARELSGGTRTRLACLSDDPTWPRALGTISPVTDPVEVPEALDALVDAAVTRYGRWAQASPVMLVHAATAPRAVALVLPALPQRLWPASYDAAWLVTATVATVYRPASPVSPTDERSPDLQEVVDKAVASGDEHAIKFTEVAVESHRRGNASALPSAARTVAMIAAG